MNRAEAKQLAQEHTAQLVRRGYAALCDLIDKPIHDTVTGASGEMYLREINVFVEDQRKKTIIVIGSITDSKRRWFPRTVTDTVVMKPDGSLL